MQIAPGHTGPITGFHLSGATGRTMRQEILYPLCRCTEIFASQFERRFLQFSLERNTCQRTFCSKVFRINIDQQCTVDIFFITGKFTHTVGNQTSLFRSCCNYLATGAHTERKCRTAIGQMTGKLICRYRQCRMACILFILRSITIRLLLFDAHTYSKRFGLHGNTTLMKHLKSIPRRMTGTQNQLPTRNRFFTVRRHHFDCRQFSIGQHQVGELCLKTDPSSQRQQFLTHIPQNNVKIIGTYMGLCIDQNILRCSAGNQMFQNKPMTNILGAGIQFAVRKCSGTALTKLHVGCQIQHTGTPEMLHIRFPLLYRSATLQQDRTQPCTGQYQRCKQACRTRTCHNRRILSFRNVHGQQISRLTGNFTDFLAVAAF